MNKRILTKMLVRKEIASSLILLLFGVFFLLYGLKYPLDQLANPGPGVFPLMAGVVLVILAGLQLVEDIRKPKPEGAKNGPEAAGGPANGLLQRARGKTKPLLLIVVFIVYLLMVKWVGFFTSNFLFVIISSKLIGARDWRRPIALSAGVSLFCYFLFEVWLKLSFPKGILF